MARAVQLLPPTPFIPVDGAQHRSALTTHLDLANSEVVDLMRRLAKKEHSAALLQLANRIQAAMKRGSESAADPF